MEHVINDVGTVKSGEEPEIYRQSWKSQPLRSDFMQSNVLQRLVR